MLKKVRKLFAVFKEYISGFSLTKKFLLAFLLIIAVPSSVFGVYSFQSIRSYTISEAKNNDQYTVQQVVSHINRSLEICKRVSQIAISNRELINFISAGRKHTPEEYIGFRRNALYQIENIHNINPDIHKLRFFVASSDIEEMWPTIYSEDRIRDKPWLDSVLELQGNNFWLFNHMEDRYSAAGLEKISEVVSLFRDVYDNGHLATLEVSMRTEVFFGSDVYGKDDEGSMLFVLINNDLLVYNDKSTFAADWSQFLTQMKQEFIKNTGQGSGDFTFELERNRFMAAYSWIKEINAVVLKVTSVEDITKRLDESRNLILLGILGGMLVLSYLIYLITSVLLKKMKKVIAAMRKIQSGDLYAEIDVEGRDEIGELARHFKVMMEKVKESIALAVRKQTAAKDSEIRALQTQINAHFIYNALEAIKTIAEINYEYDISDYLTALGRMMRYSMHWSNTYVTLKEEINHINNYIALMSLRCENRFEFKINIEDELMMLEILKMTIQPLVENAINHGLAPKNWQGRVVISAYRESDRLCIEVYDDGIGMEAQKLQLLKENIGFPGAENKELLTRGGIGLKNVNERIKLFYGDEFGLKVDSRENEYTRVIMVLPYHKGVWR